MSVFSQRAGRWAISLLLAGAVVGMACQKLSMDRSHSYMKTRAPDLSIQHIQL